MVTRRKPTRAAIRVTGKSVAYIQNVGKSGKLSKAKPVVLTTVAVGAAPVAKRTRKRRR
jgi:hypothetical protein